MQNELQIQLDAINKLISNIERDELESEKLMVGSKDFVDGYYEALLEQKEWLEGMIINYD
jgi:hypothetical protein